MSQDNLIPIGGIYTQVSPAFQRGLYEEGVRCLKSSTHDDGVVFEVKVKEATKQGFSVARGGAMPSTLQCQGARQEEGELE
jgi:hypothetical protein